MSNTKSWALWAGSLGLLGLGWSLLRRDAALASYRGQTVLVTGGTRGLGLAMARELARSGARLVLCARDPIEIERVCRELEARGTQVLGIPCDVSVRHEVEAMVEEAESVFGSIDVLINNAGTIYVGPLENQGYPEFEQAMDIMFWGHVHTVMALLPSMLARGSGAILNVTSIGGRVTVPHLLPYCCAKAAAVAFSEGLRQEAGPKGIRVLTAAPGLMRTGSYDNALFLGQRQREYAWFSLASSLPGLTVAADKAARRLLVALAENQAEHRVSLPADLLALAHGVAPGLVNDLSGLVGAALLPKPHGNAPPQPGGELAREAPSWLLAAQSLGRQAARRYQEHRTRAGGPQVNWRTSRRETIMSKTMTKNGNMQAATVSENRGAEIISTPGFTIGLGLGLLVGAVTSSLLMTRAGSDFVAFLEGKSTEIKDKAMEMLENSEIKDKAIEIVKGKAAQTLMSVKDQASEKISGAIEQAASKLGTVVEKTTEMITEQPESAGTRLDEEEEKAEAGSSGRSSSGKSSGGGKSHHNKSGGNGK